MVTQLKQRTYQRQDQRVQHRDHGGRFQYVKEQSQHDELERGGLLDLERQLYLHRELTVLAVLGDHPVPYLAVDEIENSGHGVDRHYDVGATMRQISLAAHHTFVQLADAILPIVVHRGQDLREYPVTDREERT